MQGQDESTQDGNSSSSSHSISKGQWERRLQTDIHLAKQALCEALSIDKSKAVVAADSPNIPKPAFPVQTPAQTGPYASSAENIARLLESWMKNNGLKTPPTRSNSETTTTQTGIAGSSSSPSEATFDHSVFSFNSCNNSDENGSVMQVESKPVFTSAAPPTFQTETKPNNICAHETQMPLTLLEKWLFDDAANVQPQDAIMGMGVPLAETAELFWRNIHKDVYMSSKQLN